MNVHVAWPPADDHLRTSARSLLVTPLLFLALTASVHAQSLFTPPFLYLDAGQNPQSVAIPPWIENHI